MLSVSVIPLWQGLAYLPTLWHQYSLAETISQVGTVILFLIGLAWAVWWIERETNRLSGNNRPKINVRVWDPRQLVAWYFGHKNNKLRQSVFTFVSYSCLFLMVSLCLTRLTGCSRFESPLGGGEEKQPKQVVKIQ